MPSHFSLFLITHTTANGKNVAQARIPARTWDEAIRAFQAWYPSRVISERGERGIAGNE